MPAVRGAGRLVRGPDQGPPTGELGRSHRGQVGASEVELKVGALRATAHSTQPHGPVL